MPACPLLHFRSPQALSTAAMKPPRRRTASAATATHERGWYAGLYACTPQTFPALCTLRPHPHLVKMIRKYGCALRCELDPVNTHSHGILFARAILAKIPCCELTRGGRDVLALHIEKSLSLHHCPRVRIMVEHHPYLECTH